MKSPLRVKSGGEDLRGPMSGLLLTTDVTNAWALFGYGPTPDILMPVQHVRKISRQAFTRRGASSKADTQWI